MKKIIFRTDANEYIGLGHVMRCITIAKAMKDMECIFAVSDIRTYEFINSNNLNAICLDTNYKCYNLSEAERLVNIGNIYDVSNVLVDSYYVNNEYLFKLKDYFKVICFNCRDIFLPADVIINYNIDCDKNLYKKLYAKEKTELLLGSEYVPLRDEFVKRKEYVVREKVKQILIITGGTDLYNFMGKFAKFVCNDNTYKDIKFIFISGKYNNHVEQLKEYANIKQNIIVLENVKNISLYMYNSDLVISAGGTTIYELCAIGVPTIIFSMTNNQISEAEYLGRNNIVKYLGKYDVINFDMKLLSKTINSMINDFIERKNISIRMKKIIDGQGAYRISKFITEL